MSTQPTAPPAIAELPAAPNSSTDTPTEFDAKANNTVAAQVIMVPQINTANEWAEQTAQEVYDNAVEASASADSATTSAASAASSANFIGVWEDLTGLVNKGESVEHLGAFWRATVNIPDITLQEPSPQSSVWVFSSGSSWLKVTESRDVIPNSKMQISATVAAVDIQLIEMSVNDSFTIRNNSNSTEAVRLLNSTYDFIGGLGNADSKTNLTFKPQTTRIFVCRDINVLEIL